MQRRVFFSWEADLPPARHRSLMEDALEKAAKTIRADGSIAVDPVIDRDTAGVAGAPDIAETIFAKIDRAHVFVADVSIINPEAPGRCTPNPNVLVELGYAVKTLGWERIILVMNLVSGRPEMLPFDLRGKRVLSYSAAQGDSPADARRQLTGKFETALRAIFTQLDAYAVDDRVLDLAGDLVRQETHDYTDGDVLQSYIWAQQVIERGQSAGLTAEHVEEALEVLSKRGDSHFHDFSGGEAYTFTATGFWPYARRHIPGFEPALRDMCTGLVGKGWENAEQVQQAVALPALLIEYALDLLEAWQWVQVSKALGGLVQIEIVAVATELKRRVRQDQLWD